MGPGPVLATVTMGGPGFLPSHPRAAALSALGPWVHLDGGSGYGHPLPKPWRFDHARNHARLVGHRHAPWVLFLDADMTTAGRIDLTGLDPSVGVYGVPCEGGGFSSPLLVHWTCPGRWHGRTHEYFTHPVLEDVPGGLTYRELPKSRDATLEKGARDLVLLREQMAEEPQVARWPGYMGQTFAMLGDYPQAVGWYLAATQCPGDGAWDREQRAWHLYKAGEISGRILGEWNRAETLAREALLEWPTHGEAAMLLFDSLDNPTPLAPHPPIDLGRRGFRDLDLPAAWRFRATGERDRDPAHVWGPTF